MYLWFYILRPKRVVLFPEIGWVNIFLSLTRSHSRMCIRIYISNFKKSKNRKTKKKTRIQKKQKKLKKKTVSLENRLKEKLRPSR